MDGGYKMYAKLIDGKLVYPPQVSSRPDGSTVIGYDKRDDLLVADGWKSVISTAQPGQYYAAAWQDDGTQITQVWTAYDPPDIVPMIFADGIETSVVVLKSQTAGFGIGIVADDGGELVTYIDHQSPRPPAEETKARISAAIVARKEEKASLLVLFDALASGDQKAIKDAAKTAKEKCHK